MSKNDNQMAQLKYVLLGKALVIGFFGGIFITIFFGVIHYFNMIEINIFTPWKKVFTYLDISTKWYVYPIWIIGYSIISIMIALGYYVIGKKRNHWDVGALYGFVVAVMTYIFLPVLLYNQHFLQNYLLKTHISFFVGFILYGVFIGYSISYEYALMRENIEQRGYIVE